MALRIPKKLTDLRDVGPSSPSDGDVLMYDQGTGLWLPQAPAPATPQRVFLSSDLSQSNGGAYTTIFSIPIAENAVPKYQCFSFFLIQDSATAGVGIQNRAYITVIDAISGTATLRTEVGGTTEEIDNFALTTVPSDTGAAAIPATGVPMLNRIDVALANDPNNWSGTPTLIVDFQAETTGTVWTRAGSWYEHIIAP